MEQFLRIDSNVPELGTGTLKQACDISFARPTIKTKKPTPDASAKAYVNI
jgi:hypothetical protein